ncbi:MAG: PmoA family protein [Bacteroidales bacterium]|nr:PmoA family protein [Bacteroidales bacterium]
MSYLQRFNIRFLFQFNLKSDLRRTLFFLVLPWFISFPGEEVVGQVLKEPFVSLKRNDNERTIDVLVDGKHFTSYLWPENVYKPILYPVRTSSGTIVTRGFPIEPRQGERNDHIHQVGIWLNYGNVNGIDFWGNGYRGIREPEGGVIEHVSFEKLTEGTGEAVIVDRCRWLDPGGKELLAEKTEYHFIARGSLRIIDRVTSLKATGGDVRMKDTKEGMFGIRIARQLELPSAPDETLTLLDAEGKPFTVKGYTGNDITGNYRSSEGITGNSVWGTRARWMLLYGMIGLEKISLAVCDHPENVNYPTFWHARGYGLFAANPLGARDFTQGRESLDFMIRDGETAVFRYRVIIGNGDEYLTEDEINKLADDFSRLYK